MGSVRLFPADDVADFFHRLDQLELRMKTARRVNQQYVNPAPSSRLEAVIHDGGWVGAGTLFDDINPDLFAPGFELFDGGSAKGISRDHKYFFARRTVLSSDFPDGCRFPNAIHTQENDHPRPSRKRSFPRCCCGWIEHLNYCLLQSRRHLLGRVFSTARRLVAEQVHQLLCCLYAHICRNQVLLHRFQGCLVPTPILEHVANFLRPAFSAFRKPAFQPLKKRTAFHWAILSNFWVGSDGSKTNLEARSANSSARRRLSKSPAPPS